MGHLTRSLALVLGITCAAAAPTATSDTLSILGAPAEANAQLYGLSYSGSACPQGSAKSQFDAAVNGNRLYFPDVTAVIGPNVASTDTTKNCELQILIQSDPGWKFTIQPNNIKLTAHVDVEDGVTAGYFTTYFFASSAQTIGVVKYSFTGPENDSPSVADPAPGTTYPTSSCGGGLLVVDRRVSLASGSNRSQVGTIRLYGDASGGANSNAAFVPWGALEWSKC